MSSILKALRKAEEQSPKLDVTPALPKTLDTKTLVGRRARTSRRARMMTVFSVALILFVLLVWLFPSYKDLFQSKPVDDGPPLSTPEQAPTTASLKKDEVAELEKRVEIPRDNPVATPEINMETVKKPVAEPAGPVTKEQSVSRQPQKESQEGHPDEAKYKLEAIVWAENPESRFAVINGQIVRTGGSLEGLSIVLVDRDNVAVRSGGRNWKMKFTAD